jgi:hypothetical protein
MYQYQHPRCFTHISLTTPIAPALKNYYILYIGRARRPNGHFKPLLDPGNRTAVSVSVPEAKRPLRGSSSTPSLPVPYYSQGTSASEGSNLNKYR